MEEKYGLLHLTHKGGAGGGDNNTLFCNVTTETNYVIIYTCAQYVHTNNDLEMKMLGKKKVNRTNTHEERIHDTHH